MLDLNNLPPGYIIDANYKGACKRLGTNVYLVDGSGVDIYFYDIEIDDTITYLYCYNLPENLLYHMDSEHYGLPATKIIEAIDDKFKDKQDLRYEATSNKDLEIFASHIKSVVNLALGLQRILG